MPSSLPTPFRRAVTIASAFALVLTAVFSSTVTASLAARSAASYRGLTQIGNDLAPGVASRQAVRLSAHSSAAGMVLSIGLPIRHEAALNRFLATESETHGPMTHDQFDAQFGASASQVHAVLAWTASHGLHTTYISHDGLTINVAGSTRSVEAAFHTQIANFRLGNRRFYANVANPAAPAGLHIQTVLGLNSIKSAHLIGMTRRSAVPVCPGFNQGADCYMPKQIRAAYDISQHGGVAAGQSIGFTLWGAPEVQRDFNTFAGQTGDPRISICAVTTGDVNRTACNGAHSADSIQFVEFDPKQANKDTSGLGEAAMDIEYAHGVASKSHMKYFLGGDGSNADLEAALSAAQNDKSLHIVSSSWGGALPTKASDQWLVATTKVFKAADAVGTTFLFSTGDDASDSGCGAKGLSKVCGLPEYPAISPYVLAVGGTNVQMNASFKAWSSEMVWDNWQHVDQDQQTSKYDIYSVEGGGTGCTTFFKRPSFQTGLASLTGNAGCAGRAIPDVSADGDPNNSGVLVVDGAGGTQEVTISAGTSLATPMWAGMMADTLNFEAARHIRPFWQTKGWLAPELYRLGRSSLYETYFHDVVCGYNGSPADAGWDQASGLGSPDWFAITRGIAGIAVPNTGKVPHGCHLATAPAKTAEGKVSIPKSLWPSGSSNFVGGVQPEKWLDTQSFFGQFKSHTYASAGALGNFAEQAGVPIGSDTTNPFGLWLGTDYSSSIKADRVVKDTVAHAKKQFKLNFVDCSDGYSVALPGLVSNASDYLTPDCQLINTFLKDKQGNEWSVMYWIFAVDNTVGEMLFEAPKATVFATPSNTDAFLSDSLNLASAGVTTLNHAASNADPGPLGPSQSAIVRQLRLRPGHVALSSLGAALRQGSRPR